MKAPTQEQLSDELDFEREQRESFVRELEDLEQQILDMGFRIMEKPARQASDRPIKPAAPEWDGEGLPPVGMDCERQDGSGSWVRTKLLAMSDRFIWLSDEGRKPGTYTTMSAGPFRTKAQCDREEVYILAQKAQEAAGLPGLCRERLEALYDAGLLRKEK